MKKIMTTLAAMTLAVGLFAQALPKDTLQTFDFSKKIQDSFKDFQQKYQTEREARIAKLQEMVGKRPPLAAAMKSRMDGEYCYRPLKGRLALESIFFHVFKRDIENNEMTAIDSKLADFEKNSLKKDNRAAFDVFNNIKAFYQKALAEKDPKTAFINYVDYDFNHSNETYKESYKDFFFEFSMKKALKKPTKLPNMPRKQMPKADTCSPYAPAAKEGI